MMMKFLIPSRRCYLPDLSPIPVVRSKTSSRALAMCSTDSPLFAREIASSVVRVSCSRTFGSWLHNSSHNGSLQQKAKSIYY